MLECDAAFRLDPGSVETNIVMFDVVAGTTGPVLDALAAEGIRMVPFGPVTIRATTHLDVSMADVETALAVLHRLFAPQISV